MPNYQRPPSRNELHVPSPPSKPQGSPPLEPKEVDSRQLMEGQRQLIIRHDGQPYRLIITRNNRLILQK
ncbi:hemin uptake protein HemP [Posidoniimonas polymericola]